MKSIQVARKLRGQIQSFMGIFLPHFSKPTGKFIEEIVYGIEASQDVKLSSISRSLGEDILLKKTEERLSRHLAEEGLGDKINSIVAKDAAWRVKEDTLLIIDPTDIRKEYASSMEYLDRVRDGSEGELANGYWSCLAMACDVGKRRVIPLHQRLWSAQAPGFGSENHQIQEILDTIRESTEGAGIYVMDRGADRARLFNYFLDNRLRFIIRLVGTRHLVCRGQKRTVTDLARGCSRSYRETVVREQEGKEKKYHLEYGFRVVRMPGRDEELYLVVVHGFGEEPLMLLTNLPLKHGKKRLWFVVRGYLSRWLVEEAIRFIKQSYQLEDLRVLTYERLKNLVALVLAAVYFAAVWLGESLKLSILTTRVLKVAKRFFGIPSFHYYALADGIGRLLSMLRHSLHNSVPKQPDNQQLIMALKT